MRSSDLSSDGCSSDLDPSEGLHERGFVLAGNGDPPAQRKLQDRRTRITETQTRCLERPGCSLLDQFSGRFDHRFSGIHTAYLKTGVYGKSVSVRVDQGGGRNLKKKNILLIHEL